MLDHSRVAIMLTLLVLPSHLLAQDGPIDWTTHAPRPDISPEFARFPLDANTSPETLTISTPDTVSAQGWWQGTQAVEGGATYQFHACAQWSAVPFPRRSLFCRLHWLDATGAPARQDAPMIGPYSAPGTPSVATPELPREVLRDGARNGEFQGVYRAPRTATHVRMELRLQWAPGSSVTWSQVSLRQIPPPPARTVRVAAIHFRPSGRTPLENCQQFIPLVAQAAEQHVQLAVLPETLTYYGLGMSYEACAEPIPGPSTEFFGRLARQHQMHLVVGLLERAPPLLYNVAVLIGPEGQVIGKYRKVCLPRDESDRGITPGDSYPVFDTQIGKLGMMVCYDGFFPEVARRLTEGGAEIIAFPVWGCSPLLAAARACENQVYVISSTYTDSQSHWMKTAVFGHDGETLARADDWGTLAIADLPLGNRTLWQGLGDLREEIYRGRPPSAWEYTQSGESPKISLFPPQHRSPAEP